MKTVYLYDVETGLYAGDYQAQENPLEKGEYLAPTYSTDEPPPIEKQNESALYVNGAWQVTPNFKDVEYWLADGTKDTIGEVGIALPKDALLTEPAPTPAQVKQAEQSQMLVDLEALDRVSLREVIAYIAAKADAPAALKARNLAAIVLIDKIK